MDGIINEPRGMPIMTFDIFNVKIYKLQKNKYLFINNLISNWYFVIVVSNSEYIY